MISVLSRLRRRTKAPEDLSQEQSTEQQQVDELTLPPIASGAHQTTAHLAAKVATAGLMSCLVLGPVGAMVGGLALAQSSRSVPVQPAAVADQSNDRAVVGEFAQRVVVTWLTTTSDAPAPLLALVKAAQVSTLSRDPFGVRDPTVARIARFEGIWSVTVAATVTDARKRTVRRFFQVPIRLTTTGSVTALTLPTPVSPPPVEPATSSREYQVQLGPASAQGETVAQFLTAYLAGSGDVSRYLTPGVSLTALTPAAYSAVRLDDLRGDTDVEDSTVAPVDGQQMRVLAAATASVTRQQSSSVVYALTLTARAGRWEITAIDPAPVFTAPTPAAGSPPDPAQPSTESSTTTPSGTPPAARTAT